MKRIFFYLLLAIVAVSCTGTPNKPTVIDETYNPTQEELYAHCTELKGVGDFIIGETTYKQAIHSKIYEGLLGYSVRNNFYNGYWGVAKQGAKLDKANWIEEQTSIIKQVPCPSLHLKIGQIEFHSFDLAFYDDKLAAIFFKTDNPDLHKHYIEKYGDGKGSYYWYLFNNAPCKNPNQFREIETVKEERSWENENVRLEFHHDEHHEIRPNIETLTSYQNNSWYLLTSKSLFPQFIEELNKQNDAFERHLTEKNQEVLDQF